MPTSPPKICGGYQHEALHHGPLSQRQWHQQKIDVSLRAVAGLQFQSALDAGCGSGIISIALARTHPTAQIMGMDSSESAITFCRETYRQQANLSFQVNNLAENTIPGQENKFDLIVSTEVIEHLRQPKLERFLANLYRLGTTDCRYFLSTPDYDSSWPLVEWTLDFFSLTPRLRGHQHLSFLNKRRLSCLLHAAGFQINRLYNFCGFGPLLKSVIPIAAAKVEKWETRLKKGMLIGCEFSKKHPLT